MITAALTRLTKHSSKDVEAIWESQKVKRNSKLHHNHTVQFAEQPFQNSPEMLAGQNPPRRDCLSFSSLHHPCQYFLEKPEIKCVKITGSVMR